MGYTHYWYRNPAKETPEMFGRFALDAMRLVTVATTGGLPLEADFTEGVIRVNGVGPDACEDFWWSAVEDGTLSFDDGSTFGFTKTRQRPYDAAVCALLLRARHHYLETGMSIASDGLWPDWAEGLALYERAFGPMLEPEPML